MTAITQTLSVAIKELRELLRRPMLVLTLVLGPLIIMVIFGVGTKNVAEPPRAIVVIPPGAGLPRLVQDYRREFNQFLQVQEYTTDEEYARGQLAKGLISAVVILPPTPYETIAGGEQARIRVLYNEIDPARRQLVPDFVRVMVGDINRELFLQNADQQQAALGDAAANITLALRALTLVDEAAARGDRAEARLQVQTAQRSVAALDDALGLLGPEATPFQQQVILLRRRLQEADRTLQGANNLLATPDPRPIGEQIGLTQTRKSLQDLSDALDRLTSVPPEVAIAPLAADTEDVTRLNSDLISFYAPAMLALIIQHAAVSLGALAIVRERLSGTFELYQIAPTSNLQLLLGKYLAYFFFVLAVGALLLGVLISPLLRVPLFGDPWRVALTLILMTLASIGLGLALSLLAVSERQAVQFSMLALLAIVFFGGFALPLDALKQPALTVAYALPATYGGALLKDIMLKGLPGSNTFIIALGVMAAGLFFISLALLHWRTRPA